MLTRRGLIWIRLGLDHRYRGPVPLRPWRHHLAEGEGFDPTGVSEPAELPAAWAKRWADDPGALVLAAVDAGGTTRWMTAGELDERSGRAAEAWGALGIGPGSRVLWIPDRSPEAVVCHLGAWRAGATVVPVDPRLTGRELAHVVSDAGPAAAAAPAELVGAVAAAGVPVVADLELHRLAGGTDAGPGGLAAAAPAPLFGPTPALIAYTSGTTGSPKGAMLSHANLLANSRALCSAWRWGPGDRLVHTLPLFHGHGLCVGLYTTLLAGASLVLLPGFDVDGALDAVEDVGATLFFGVPTMYHRIAASGRAEELGRLRLAVSGSAPLPAALHRQLAARGTVVLERYGMTETLMTVSNPVEGERRAGTVGFPLPGVEAEVDEGTGELRVRGPQVFSGYLGRPHQSAEAFDRGWFRTGDVGEVDDGYLRLLGRAGDLVISGGFNVYPAEVEDVLARHPAVAEVAVTGTPSEEWGELVTAWVVRDGPLLDAEELLRFAAAELAPYKRPRLVRFVESLPRNALGKVRRSDLA
jgi:malonyl-CoA/methylmalonyl-CoA synthetase